MKMENKIIFAMAFFCLASSRPSASAEVETQCTDPAQDRGCEDKESMETGYIDESLNKLDQVIKVFFSPLCFKL